MAKLSKYLQSIPKMRKPIFKNNFRSHENSDRMLRSFWGSKEEQKAFMKFSGGQETREVKIIKVRPHTLMQNSTEYIKKCKGRKWLLLLWAKNPQEGNSQRNTSSAHPCALIYMPACICKQAWICTCGARWAGHNALRRLLEGKECWDLARTPTGGGSELQSE